MFFEDPKDEAANEPQDEPISIEDGLLLIFVTIIVFLVLGNAFLHYVLPLLLNPPA